MIKTLTSGSTHTDKNMSSENAWLEIKCEAADVFGMNLMQTLNLSSRCQLFEEERY